MRAVTLSRVIVVKEEPERREQAGKPRASPGDGVEAGGAVCWCGEVYIRLP